ncbi:nudix hydrolase, partial [gut metagenome]
MELVDLLDENRLPLGRTAERLRPFVPGEYRSVVHICVFNSSGEMLIQKRRSDKKLWPGRWDVAAAGGVSAGETSRTAAEREFAEEMGVPLDLTDVRPTVTVNFGRGFDDFFVVVRDIPLSALHL